MDVGAFARFIAPYARRIGNMFVRGKVTGSKSSGRIQTLQITLIGAQPKSDVEHFEPYGFTSNPLPGAEHIAAALGGDTSHCVVVVASDRRYRVQGLEPGEVAIFTDEGDFIRMKRGRVVEINTHTLRINAQTKVEINTDIFEVNALTKSQFTTPEVDMSALLNVVSTVTGTGGFSFTGTPTLGGPTGYVTGAIHFNGVQITADGGSTQSYNGKRIDDTLKVSGVQPGSGDSGNPI